MEFRCPNCCSLIYSRKCKICEQCKINLPAELVLSDEQNQEQQEQRDWACNIANAFGSSQSATSSKQATQSSAYLRSQASPPGNVSANQKALQHITNMGRLSARPVPRWVYLGVSAVAVAALVIVWAGFKGETRILLFIGLLIGSFMLWASIRDARTPQPICPQCKGNIANCAILYCYLCGKPTRGGRCDACGVDESTWAWMSPLRLDGRIEYCPGCGAWLDSEFRRWRPHGE